MRDRPQVPAPDRGGGRRDRQPPVSGGTKQIVPREGVQIAGLTSSWLPAERALRRWPPPRRGSRGATLNDGLKRIILVSIDGQDRYNHEVSIVVASFS